MTIIWYEKVPQIFEDGNYIAARPLYIISKNIEAGSLLYHTKRNKMLNSNRVKSYWLFTLISQILWCMYIYCRLQYLLQLAMVCTKFLSIHSTLNSVQRSTICLTYMDGTVCIYRHFFLKNLPIVEGERMNQNSWFWLKFGRIKLSNPTQIFHCTIYHFLDEYYT